jgi:hypothetical protein
MLKQQEKKLKSLPCKQLHLRELMKYNFKEKLLQFIWEHQLFSSSYLKTTTGELISVVKPGFLNHNSGPDFENAEIKIGESKFYGSVEIHIDGKDWYSHHHHKDETYNNVILHVCYSINSDVKRQDETSIPSLELKHILNQETLQRYHSLMQNQSFIPCENHLKNVSRLHIGNWIDRVIIEKFENRFGLFNAYLNINAGNWNSACYTAFVRAFGMPINTDAFEDIATRLPLDMVLKYSSSLFQLEALFFGTAGLLNRDFESPYLKNLKKEYKFLSAKEKLKVIPSMLKFGRMRPMNLPTVKLAQLSSLFHHDPSILTLFISSHDRYNLKYICNFEVSEYWINHYSLDKESAPRSKNISLQMVNHLLLNALIPFKFFYEKNKKDGNVSSVLAHLAKLPSEKNAIIRNWESLNIASDSALCSQALLHLYKTKCTKKLCLSCNIGRKILLRE